MVKTDCHADMSAMDYYEIITGLLRSKRRLAEYLDTTEQLSQALALIDIAIRNACREAAAAGHSAALQNLACKYGDNLTVLTICSLCVD